MNILINNQQNCRRLNRTGIRKTARKILSILGRSTAELSILFVDDKGMQRLNSAFRGLDRTTDVLSFEALIPVRGDRHDGRFVLGDIVINTQKAASRAGRSREGFNVEIYRLLVHGIMHLLGYRHEKSRRDALIMRRKEREILNAIKETG